MSETVCDRSDLPASMCSHCRGHDSRDVVEPPIAQGIPIRAQFDGRCEVCDRGIPVDDEIVRTLDYGWVHLNCARVV